jgi:hypothetical protein
MKRLELRDDYQNSRTPDLREQGLTAKHMTNGAIAVAVFGAAIAVTDIVFGISRGRSTTTAEAGVIRF